MKIMKTIFGTILAIILMNTAKADPFGTENIKSAGLVSGITTLSMASLESCLESGYSEEELKESVANVNAVKTIYLNYVQHKNAPTVFANWNEEALNKRVEEKKQSIENMLDCVTVQRVIKNKLLTLSELDSLKEAIRQADVMPNYRQDNVGKYFESLIRVENAIAVIEFCTAKFPDLDKDATELQKLKEYLASYQWYYTNSMAPEYVSEEYIENSGSDGLKHIDARKEYLDLRATSKGECKDYFKYDADMGNFISSERLYTEAVSAKARIEEAGY